MCVEWHEVTNIIIFFPLGFEQQSINFFTLNLKHFPIVHKLRRLENVDIKVMPFFLKPKYASFVAAMT
jgi:hypothetical protein